ncbi:MULTISPECIES: DCC1-like thiol-disulfide oxidoreductase family protein [Bordetella]|uniref:DUF393 domain-containing protein n=1 Tax=Bordetella genomosp. 6 TaxID=463024 RepID=A0ABX4FFT9_9BORD|nr:MULTISPECIES: DCC1-like thiol-disulfide oxidoreductase family protein [Bordetella]AOB26184.1 hypothetical protein BBB44_07920 [Bordetella bronchiseptica]AZW43473.1 DUF393 domain-containing protein [Bordetella bronchiseptica]OZI75375.1 hypothetical protein CAL23_15710 [Bordetella genomosp. 6]
MPDFESLRNRKGVSVIYDGDCPFCANYIRIVRLRKTVGDVQLIDARQDLELAAQMRGLGYDLDNGMVAIIDGEVAYDDEAVHRLALLSSNSTLLNRINKTIMGNKPVSMVLYPILKLGRRMTLRLLGRTSILS